LLRDYLAGETVGNLTCAAHFRPGSAGKSTKREEGDDCARNFVGCAISCAVSLTKAPDGILLEKTDDFWAGGGYR